MSGFAGCSATKEHTRQSRRCKRHGFNPWVRKIRWRRKWEPTPVFLTGESHKKSLAGTVHRLTKTWTWLSAHVHAHTDTHTHSWRLTLPTWAHYFKITLIFAMDVPDGSAGKETACNAGDVGSIPGSGRSPGEGNGNPLQYCCLRNPMDRGAWRATLQGVPKSWMWLRCSSSVFLDWVGVGGQNEEAQGKSLNF